jgi:hypothetical protein
VPVRFVAARWSAAELDAMARRLAERNFDTVASVGPSADFGGLDVELKPEAAAFRAASAQSALEGLSAQAAAPVRIVGTADPVVASRHSDISPYRGGALITGPSNCSTGVSVSVGSTSYITTAWHCGTGTWRTWGGGRTLGPTGARSQSRDTELIQTSSDPVVYRGAWNAPRTSGLSVYRGERPANNTRICTSGGVTGETCGETYVRGIGMYTNITGVGTVGPGFWILSQGTSGGVQIGIVQPGDSGSPAYTYVGVLSATVKGLVVAADTNFPTQCKGNPSFSPGPRCSARAFAVNVMDALPALNATLKLGA